MIIAPGSTIGILGGGQLGRMTALAAARLGYRCHVFGPEQDSPAKQVAALSTTAQYSDQAALRRFVELGRGAAWLAREVDIAYRKPCFAGQTMRVAQQAFVHEGRLGVVAMLIPDPGAAARGDDGRSGVAASARPHTFMRMMFEP